MGLFTNSKKGCPVCGEPTPRIFPTKVDGIPICKACNKKIFLPNGKLNEMSLDEFLEYMNFYEENQGLRDIFFESYTYNSGFCEVILKVDTAHGLFCMNDPKEGLVFEAANLKSIRVLEGEALLFEGEEGVFNKFKSDVPERVWGLRRAAEEFRISYAEYERMEAREKERQERAREQGQTITTRYIPRPTFDDGGLFKKFYLEMTFDHPYWSEVRWEISAPSFDFEYPRVEDYMSDYENKVEEFRALAVNVMQLIDPNVQMADGDEANSEAAQPVSAVDAVEEIKKYKELLDMGIITEEEFAVKKHELLGL